MNSWDDVEKFFDTTTIQPDAASQNIRDRSLSEGLPAIEVSAGAGKLLMLLAQISGAQRVLEIGTLGGFSTLWLARGIPADGVVVTCEYDARHAAVARENLNQAGVGDKVDIRVGAANDTLAELEGPFDLIFIDADKENNPNYLQAALRLGRPGALVIVDNVARAGEILDPGEDPDHQGTVEALKFLGTSKRFEATAIQTVGSKGWDGFALAVIKAEGDG